MRCQDAGVDNDATIVISGAGSGIGRAAAVRLHGDGMHVTAVGRREEPLRQLATDLAGGIEVVAADVATPAGASLVADRLRATGRACRGVVAAAGGLSPAPTGLDRVRQGWQDAFESNVLTAVVLVEALLPTLEQASGRVVLLSSVAALRGSGGGAYGAMKAALHAWMFDLAATLGPHGGTANVVAPGFVPDTEFWAGRLTEQSRTQRVGQTLVGRAGTPQEVASLIGWLLGPDGGWVTGQVLSPNGGVVLGR
jgi:NAD(P)-dependent dehydrogenase (short-subunit alcohol dehydrogenase family)